jgi:hypothetical protein
MAGTDPTSGESAHAGNLPSDCDGWLRVLSDLHCDTARGKAPHKPLLLLVLCDLAEEGKLSAPVLPRRGDLAFRSFDRGFWSIADDLTILVAADRFHEAGPEAVLLTRLARCALLRPKSPGLVPDPKSLAWPRKRHRFE